MWSNNREINKKKKDDQKQGHRHKAKADNVVFHTHVISAVNKSKRRIDIRFLFFKLKVTTTSVVGYLSILFFSFVFNSDLCLQDFCYV